MRTVDLCPPVWIFALVCQSCWTQAICALFCSVCVWECVYDEFPGECDITQRGVLLGVLLLLPATPLLESMILHTHTLAPTEVTPTGPNFPLHLQLASVCIYTSMYVCECVCLLSASRLNQCSLQNLSAGAPAAANQPASQSKCLICSLSVDRPITGRISQEGPATWVRTVALATSIIILEAGEGEKDFFLLFFNKSAKKGGYILWIFRSDIWKYSNLEISCVSSLLHFLNTRVHGWNKGASPAVSKLCCPISSSTGGGYRGVCIPFLVLYSWPPECIIVKTWNNTLKFTES